MRCSIMMNGKVVRARHGNRHVIFWLLTLSGLFSASSDAQTPEQSSSGIESPSTATTRVLPAKSSISLRFIETLVSGVSTRGAAFRMEVSEDVRVRDEVVIPKGTVAYGEVVDSKKAGMLGKVGVLVLSARYLHLEQRDIRLASALGAAGNSRNALAFFIPFVMGGQARVEQGTEVTAHTAADEYF